MMTRFALKSAVRDQGSGVRNGRPLTTDNWRLASISRAGVTLVEVIVVLGIMSVFTTAMFSLLLTALGSWDKGSGKTISDTTASLALQKAARAIDEGKSAVVSGGTLLVQMPLVNDQGDYDRSQNGDMVKLYLSGGTLYVQTNTSTPLALATGMTSAAFTVNNLEPYTDSNGNGQYDPGEPYTDTDGDGRWSGRGPVTLAVTASGQTGKNVMQTQIIQAVKLRNSGAS